MMCLLLETPGRTASSQQPAASTATLERGNCPGDWRLVQHSTARYLPLTYHCAQQQIRGYGNIDRNREGHLGVSRSLFSADDLTQSNIFIALTKMLDIKSKHPESVSSHPFTPGV